MNYFQPNLLVEISALHDCALASLESRQRRKMTTALEPVAVAARAVARAAAPAPKMMALAVVIATVSTSAFVSVLAAMPRSWASVVVLSTRATSMDRRPLIALLDVERLNLVLLQQALLLSQRMPYLVGEPAWTARQSL
jgi:hypothetical protein